MYITKKKIVIGMSLVSYYPHLKHFNTSKESVFFQEKNVTSRRVDWSVNKSIQKGAVGKDLKKGSITNKGRVFHKKGVYEPFANSVLCASMQ